MSSGIAMADSEARRIQTQLMLLFAERLNVQVPSEQTDLFESGILDSQKFVELLVEIERRFNRWIDGQDFEIENFRSVEKIANLILQRKGASTSLDCRTHNPNDVTRTDVKIREVV